MQFSAVNTMSTTMAAPNQTPPGMGGGIRTPDLLLRRQLLNYPSELHPYMVPVKGLEPLRFWQGNLNPPSLPFPPYRRLYSNPDSTIRTSPFQRRRCSLMDKPTFRTFYSALHSEHPACKDSLEATTQALRFRHTTSSD